MFESGAILLWLAEREGAFLPHAPAPRAEVIQWLMVQMANIGPMFGQLNHFRMSLAGQGDPYATGRYQAASDDQLDRFFGQAAQMPAADFSNLRHR